MSIENTIRNYYWDENKHDSVETMEDCFRYFKSVFKLIDHEYTIDYYNGKYKQILAYTSLNWITSIFINENLNKYMCVIHARDTGETQVLLEKDFVDVDKMLDDIVDYYYPIWSQRLKKIKSQTYT